jgi:PAS domain S-box-containing protein
MKEDSASREDLLRQIQKLKRQLSHLKEAQDARAQAEQALAESEAHLRSLMESATNFVVYRLAVDESSPYRLRVVFVSPSIREILGVEDISNLGAWFEQVHPEDLPRVLKSNLKAFITNRFSETGRVWHQKSNSWRWIQVMATGIHDPKGKPAFVNGIMIDVTDRVKAEQALAKSRERLGQEVALRTAKLEATNRQLQQEFAERERAEEAFRESEERFRRAFERAGVGMALINPEGRFLQVNRFLCDLLGRKAEDMVGKDFQRFTYQEDVPRNYADFRALAEGKREYLFFEKRYLHNDGHLIWVTVNFSVVRDSFGRPVYIVAHIQDINDRKRAEEALLQLAAGVAHNFNNVLMAILGNAQAAQQAFADENPKFQQVAHLLDNVVQGARGGRDVVHRLSRFVGRRQGAYSPAEVVDFSDLLHSLRKSLPGIWPQFAEGNLKLELTVDKELYVTGVRGELMEVLLNIIKNAVEAMPNGGTLYISSRVEGDMVHITFRDTGRGVEQDELIRLFDPFFTTKGVAGQGLGLAVSKGIIQSHGGTILAESPPGQGLSLTISLPLTASSPLKPEPAERMAAPETSLNLLLVEDEGLVAMGIQALLGEAGHQVRRADCLSQALNELESFEPNLVLCDLGLPDGSGWEVVGRLRAKMESLAMDEVPILVVSGWSDDQLDPLPHGMKPPAGFLHKPVDRRLLLEKVSSLGTNKR